MINSEEVVKNQYAKADNLSTRISIHDKYSTNKMGFGNWIFSNYEIEPGMKVLELGCGTGSMWKGQDALMARCRKLVLSDFSEGMVEMTRGNLGEHENVEFKVIDVQNIPFEDESFDVVIANMMLYHVPDLQKGLQEVRRVLKEHGKFYCATFGENGMMEYISGLLKGYGVTSEVTRAFTLQNGAEKLSQVFAQVQRFDYPDALEVTNLDDMADYVYSLTGVSGLKEVPREKLLEVLAAHTVDGILRVPKEYGMFVAE